MSQISLAEAESITLSLLSDVCRLLFSLAAGYPRAYYIGIQRVRQSQRFTIRQVPIGTKRWLLPRSMCCVKLALLERPKSVEELKEIMQDRVTRRPESSELKEQRDVNMRWALVLRALPLYLHEDASKFFRTYNSADGPDLTDTPVALLTVISDDTTDGASSALRASVLSWRMKYL
ncbi:hypothetical protein INR49_003930 [Caranx melampygus]|nr:hypothetical protein INR49_003930 [Caranx melampygus]